MVWTSSRLRTDPATSPVPESGLATPGRRPGPRFQRRSQRHSPLAALLLAAALAAGPAAGAPPRPTRAPAAAYGFAELHPAWLQGSFWRGRPWPTGWYRTLPRAWGRQGMVPVATLTATVNAALAQRQVWIAIPNTALLLNVGSVDVLPNSRVVFFHAPNPTDAGTIAGGESTQRGVGECQLGLLNGRPVNGEQALLLHAACVVAFARGA